MSEMTVEATVENMDAVVDFVNENLEQLGCNMKAQVQIDIAIDELFGNIVRYAYNPDIGTATISIEPDGDSASVSITFKDHGVPYNPLEKPDPDVTLSAEERTEGGLGIYLVKKSMDGVEYEYKDGQNILKVKKKIQ